MTSGGSWRLRSRAASLLGVLLVLASGLEAQSAEQGAFSVRSYEPSVYEGHPQVWGIAQDPDGILYAANADGLLEFDGERWRRFRHPNARVLLAITVHSDGPIYVGCMGDVGFYRRNEQGGYDFHSLLEHLPAEFQELGLVRDVREVPGGAVLFSTRQRLFLWSPADSSHLSGEVRVIGQPQPGLERARTYSPSHAFEGSVLLTHSERGLMELRDGALHSVPGGEGLAHQPLMGMVRLEKGDRLACSASNGLFRETDDSWSAWDSPASRLLHGRKARGMLALPSGRLMVVTEDHGMVLFDQQGEVLRTLDSAATANQRGVIGRPHLDPSHGLWLPTGSGIRRLELESPIEVFDDRHGLSGQVLSIERHEGGIAVGTTSGLFMLEAAQDPSGQGRFRPLVEKQWCWDLLSHEGWLLCGMNVPLVARRGDQAQVVQGINAPRAFLAAADGSMVYVAGLEGLSAIEQVDGSWVNRGPLAPTESRLLTLIEGPDGDLWCTARPPDGSHRIERFQPDGGGMTAYGEDQGVPSHRMLYPFPWRGRLWLGSADGLLRFEPDEDRFVPDETLWQSEEAGFVEDRAVIAPAVDPHDRLWFVQSSDLSARAEFTPDGPLPLRYPLARDGPRQYRVFHFEAEDGVVWAGSSDGKLARYAEAREVFPEPHETLLRSFAADGETLLGGVADASWPVLELPYLPERGLRFQFSCPDLWSVSPLAYQSRMVGLSEEWSAWSRETYRDFTSLREGDYRFEVRAGSAGGGVGPASAVEFRILPPWYRSWWATLGFLLTGGVGIQLLTSWRIGVHRRRGEEQERRADELAEEIRQRKLAEAERERAQSARERLEDQLRQAQKLEAVGTLAAGVAHDFNNLLTGILGYADLAERQAADDPKLSGHLENVRGLAMEAAGVTRGLLTFSRKADFQKTKLDLGRALSQTLKLLKRILPASIELGWEVEDEVHVLADETQLKQVIMNLAVNARDAMPDGGKLLVSLRAEEPAGGDEGTGSAVLQVADTGEGIPEEVRERLFEPFFTTKSRDRGTGLGLSIVLGIVEQHQGTIEIDSAPGAGTRVTVRLPLSEPPSGRDRGAPDRAEPRSGSGAILIAEDDPAIRAMVVDGLRQAGFEPLEAPDGAKALQVFAAHGLRLRAAVLDLDMPKLSGTVVLREIRASCPDLPILVISGSPDARGEELAGASDLLRKPFRTGELIDLLIEWTAAP